MSNDRERRGGTDYDEYRRTRDDSTSDSVPWPGKRTLTQTLRGPQSAARSASPGRPVPTAQRGRFEASLGTDLGDVRVHTDDRAAAFADEHQAQAITVGSDIYFGGGWFAPDTSEGDHLLAHEVAHTVQQRGNEAVGQARLEVGSANDPAEADADRAAAAMVVGAPARVSAAPPAARRRATEAVIAGSGDPIDWRTYVTRHKSQIQSALATAHTGVTAAGSEFAQLADASALVSRMLKEPIADIVAELHAASSPQSPAQIVNAARGAEPGEAATGKPEWEAAVGTQLAIAYGRAVQRRVIALMPAYLRALNEAVQQYEEAHKSHPTASPPSSQVGIEASHPMDPRVRAALCGGGVVRFNAAGWRKENPNPIPLLVAAPAAPLRAVTGMSFLAGSGSWMWVRVTAPADATPAEVAASLLGDATFQHLLTPAAPLYGFRLPPSGKLAGGWDAAWRAAIGSSATPSSSSGALSSPLEDPKKTIVGNELGGGRVDPNIDPATEIVNGPYAEAAALNQAKGLPELQVEGTQVADTMRISMQLLRNMAVDARPFGLAGPLTTAAAKLDKRSNFNTSKDAQPWAAQAEKQRLLISRAAEGLRIAADSRAAAESSGDSGVDLNAASYKPLRDLAAAYVDGAALSDLVSTAEQRLTDAAARLASYPIDVLQAVMDRVHQLLASCDGKFKATATDKFLGQPRLAPNSLQMATKYEETVRKRLESLRSSFLKEPTKALDELKKVQRMVKVLEMASSLSAVMTSIDDAIGALSQEDLRGKPEFEKARALFGKLSGIAQKFRSSNVWEVKGGVDVDASEEQVQHLRSQIDVVQKDTDIPGLLQSVASVLEDKAKRDALIRFGAVLGIALLSGGVGGAIGGVVGVIAEVATFTLATTALFNRNAKLSEIAADFAVNLALAGAMKFAGSRIGGVSAELGMLEKNVRALAVNTVISTAVTMTEQQIRAIVTGTQLTEEQVADKLMENFVFVVGTQLGHALHQGVLVGVLKKGSVPELDTARSLSKEASNAAVIAETVKRYESGKALCDKAGAAFRAQNRAAERLEEITTQKEQAAREGRPDPLPGVELNPDKVGEIKAAGAAAAEAAQAVEVVSITQSLTADGPDLYSAETAEFDRATSGFEKAGLTVVVGPKDPISGHRSASVKTRTQATDTGSASKARTITVVERGARAPLPDKPARVEGPKEGVFDDIPPITNPEVKAGRWTFSHTVGLAANSATNPGGLGGDVQTFIDYTGPDGTTKSGYMHRGVTYDPATKSFKVTMSLARIDELPSWFNEGGGTPLREGKGVPLQTYVTIQQMRTLGVEYATIKQVKLSMVINAETVVQVAIWKKQGRAITSALLMETKSVSYSRTSIEQSGSQVVDVRMTSEGGDMVLADVITKAPEADRARVTKMATDAGFQMTDVVKQGFNIELDVVPWSGGGAGGSP